MTTVRCVTLNLEHGRPAREGIDDYFSRALAQLRDVDADVVLVQEADGAARDWMTHSGGGHVHDIASFLGMNWVYAPSAFGYGVGVLSRFPIVAARYLRLPPVVRPVYRKPNGKIHVRWPEPRVALYALLDSGSHPLIVGTTHLDIDQQAAPHQLRITATGFSRVADHWGIDSSSSSFLLTGDLNMRPDAVESALAEVPVGIAAPRTVLATGLTYPHNEPRWQIDHVLGYRINAIHSEVLSTSISDHAGLVADIQPF